MAVVYLKLLHRGLLQTHSSFFLEFRGRQQIRGPNTKNQIDCWLCISEFPGVVQSRTTPMVFTLIVLCQAILSQTFRLRKSSRVDLT